MVDDDLLRRVELKRNAANAHDVNFTMSEYRSYAKAHQRNPTPYLTAKFTSLHFTLSEFADTGDIKKAIKNNPTYKFIKSDK